MIKLHPSNVGKEIVTNGKRDKICYISANGEYFRLEAEKNGPIVYDYKFEEIVACEELIVMFKAPTWERISFNPVRV